MASSAADPAWVTTSDTAPVADADLRCPTCSARRTHGALWCSQCHQRFDPVGSAAATEPATSSAAGRSTRPSLTKDAPARVGSLVPSGNSGDSTAAATSAEQTSIADELSEWDRRHRQTGQEMDDLTRIARTEEAMAAWAGSDQSLPLVARQLAGVASSPLGQLMLVCGAGAVLVSVGVLGMLVIGLLL